MTTRVVERCERGAPVEMLVHIPESNERLAVVVFQHGFMTRNSAYDEVLRHLASHGFLVVAPQMYTPGVAALFGRPTAAEEADLATQILDWLPGNLGELTGRTPDFARLGLGGHSRGGKVAWLTLRADPTCARAIAGVDPVDGAGGPLGGQTRVTEHPFDFSIPALVIGTGLGGSCAPEGDNYVQFYAASQSPAWRIVVFGQGHGDMLDEDVAGGFAARICATSNDRAPMRQLTAGLLTAFFRVTLQDDAEALSWLTNPAVAPLPFEVEAK